MIKKVSLPGEWVLGGYHLGAKKVNLPGEGKIGVLSVELKG